MKLKIENNDHIYPIIPYYTISIDFWYQEEVVNEVLNSKDVTEIKEILVFLIALKDDPALYYTYEMWDAYVEDNYGYIAEKYSKFLSIVGFDKVSSYEWIDTTKANPPRLPEAVVLQYLENKYGNTTGIKINAFGTEHNGNIPSDVFFQVSYTNEIGRKYEVSTELEKEDRIIISKMRENG